MDQLQKLETPAYAALRVVAGFLLACHGAQKMFGWWATKPMPSTFSQLWWGGIIELVGGALVAIGLGTRIAAFLVSGMMAVAFFQFHMKGNFHAGNFLPIVNGGELAALNCFVFLFIAARGAGRFAVERT